MLGNEFARTLQAAQSGDETAFIRLWRDTNPAVTRYLRVLGMDDPSSAACETWVTVVRGLPGFSGDETAWRVWLLGCARRRGEEGSLRRAWGSGSVTLGTGPAGHDAITLEDLTERSHDHALVDRGVNDTVAALRALPLGQGEVLALRLGIGLPLASVAQVVGADRATVERSEARALERLGTAPDLVAWSLDAPPSPTELVDERVVTGTYRSMPSSPRVTASRTKVIAVGVPAARRPVANAGAGSWAAMVGVATVSAGAMSLGGLTAAAYAGVLPDRVQQVMHQTIGAPAPAPSPLPGRGREQRPAPGGPVSTVVPRGAGPAAITTTGPVRGGGDAAAPVGPGEGAGALTTAGKGRQPTGKPTPARTGKPATPVKTGKATNTAKPTSTARAPKPNKTAKLPKAPAAPTVPEVAASGGVGPPVPATP